MGSSRIELTQFLQEALHLLDEVRLRFEWLYWVLTGQYWVLLSVTGFYWIGLETDVEFAGMSQLNLVSLGTTKFFNRIWVGLVSWVLLSFTGFYWIGLETDVELAEMSQLNLVSFGIILFLLSSTDFDAIFSSFRIA